MSFMIFNSKSVKLYLCWSDQKSFTIPYYFDRIRGNNVSCHSRMVLAGIQEKRASGYPIRLVLASFKRGAFGYDNLE